VPKPIGNRRERRAEDQLQRRAQRQEEQAKKSDEREHIPPPKSVGRPRQAKELEEHKRATRKRERGRQAARHLVEEALKQQRRQRGGASLTADEQRLADFAKTLSPTKVLGAGFRMAVNQDEDIDLSEDEDAIEELMEGTGCGREEAREALSLSCDWTHNGKPSRVKAARWLDGRRTEGERQDEKERKSGSDSDCKVVRRRSMGGTLTETAGRADGSLVAAALGTPVGRGSEEDTGNSNAESQSTEKLNQKPVLKDPSSETEGCSSTEGVESHNSQESSSSGLTQSLDSSPVSSDQEESSSSSEEEVGRKKRRDGSEATLFSRSQRRSRGAEAVRATRYVRQLALALKIDLAWAREVYDQCVSEGTTSYDGLLRRFYRNECEHAKGTQKETAKPLTTLGRMRGRGAVGSGDINMTLPTFQLPEWGSGQPPNGGVHFSTLQRMLEAYEKYDKQTNFTTQVTFKSMVASKLKPNLESKCKLPPTVWLPPVESDWMEVVNGRPEKGGWSDLRFLRRIRKVLQPAGRTNYEIMFEKSKLRHRGNDQQLVVALDLWGTNWLAQEREAEDQGKALPAQKMKLYFRKAVEGVPRFRRWLEGRKFVSCQDWYGVLCRKLHKSLGKTAEAAYDRELEGSGGVDYGREGGRNYGTDRAGSVGWLGGRGGGPTGSGDRSGRGGGVYRGSYGGRGSSGSTGTDERAGNFRKFSEDGAGARGNAHTAGGTITPHSGGVEPMTTSGSRGGSSRSGGFRTREGHDRKALFDGAKSPRSSRQPVNSGSEELLTKLSKGARWHDSTMSSCKCRDPDCGVRQECPFCQGCGLHGHDRPYCYKSGEPRFNPTGYWCINRPNENPIEGLGTPRDRGPGVATARGNMMDASHK
jgi:hypothetical protein